MEYNSIIAFVSNLILLFISIYMLNSIEYIYTIILVFCNDWHFEEFINDIISSYKWVITSIFGLGSNNRFLNSFVSLSICIVDFIYSSHKNNFLNFDMFDESEIIGEYSWDISSSWVIVSVNID